MALRNERLMDHNRRRKARHESKARKASDGMAKRMKAKLRRECPWDNVCLGDTMGRGSSSSEDDTFIKDNIGDDDCGC